MSQRSIELCGEAVDQPGHICAFFSSREAEYEVLIPYIGQGVREHERVVNVLDAARIPEHRTRLHAAGIPLHDGPVSIFASEETYLTGGRFEIDRMTEFVRTALSEAAAEGKRVRTVGWMDWMHLNAPGTEQVMEYEARMNMLVPDFDCTFMCVYDLAHLDGQTVVDILATHPYAVLNGAVRRNAFYVPPEEYLENVLGPPKAQARTAR